LFVIIYESSSVPWLVSWQIKELKAKLGDEDALSSVKEEPAASDIEAPVAGAAMAAQGSSDSDSSGVVNDAEKPPSPPAVPAEAAAVAGSSASQLQHGEVFFHGQLLKVEEDEAAFLGDDDAACGGFFADLQPPPSLPWWTEATDHWA
jgi:homeobox-leucine zipper protein